VTDVDALLRGLAEDVEFPPTPRVAGPVLGRIETARRRRRRSGAAAAACLVTIASALAFVDPPTFGPGAEWAAAVSAEGGLPPKHGVPGLAEPEPVDVLAELGTNGALRACLPDRSCP
jgi:hypothetical protein